MIFVDANLLLRVLTEPTSQKTAHFHKVATSLLRQAETGGIEFTTSDAVLAEVAFILTSKNHDNFPVPEAAEMLAAIARLRGFRHENKRTLLRALDIWTEFPRIGFVDALTAAYARAPGMLLATFDTDFDRIPGIDHWEPVNSD
jgi:predicted nucleic acid-binding protein